MFNIEQQIKDYGLYLSNCISQEDIDYILYLSKSDGLNKGTSRLGSHTVIAHEEITWSEALEISNKVFAKIHPVMIKSMEIYCRHLGLDINEYTMMPKPTYWIKTYDIGANIGNHSDSWESEDGKTMVPAISIVLYLSSDFEGGELVFVDKDSVFKVFSDTGVTVNQNEKDIIIKPSSGHIAIFDSNVIHKVNPVLSGNRISTDIVYMK
jgi:predicted 2-oxoglutarate/Fe(II)-dependent dioxygenase YbiX